ncbi:MAG: hypothetical protein V3V15_02055 [Sphingorhabdus sp.]
MINRNNLAKLTIAALLAAGGGALSSDGSIPSAKAHPGPEHHDRIMKRPIAGVRNNYWYDYQSDVLEAENELRKDLRRAKTGQDRREAWEEYNRELIDARKDYRKEMIEKGYIRHGRVTVLD